MRGTEVRGRPIKLYSSLSLVGTSVEGDLWLNCSNFEYGLDANDVRVGRNLSMSQSAVRGDSLRLKRATVGADLEMDNAYFERPVDGERLRVNGNLILRKALFAWLLKLPLAQIGGNLELGSAKLSGLDLSGANIGGMLRLGSAFNDLPVWSKEEETNHNWGLVLRAARAGAIVDPASDVDAWPPLLDLEGFTYGRLGGSPREEDERLAKQPLDRYLKWLELDPVHSHQPYTQLASVFRTAGYSDRADAVLRAAQDRRLAEAWRTSNYADVMGLFLSKILIGYAIGNGIFLSLAWVLGLTTAGALILYLSVRDAQDRDFRWCWAASLDHLLPIVTLNKNFEEFFGDPHANDLDKRRFKGWQLAYFAVHALFGFVLGGFVAAGLTGLTQPPG